MSRLPADVARCPGVQGEYGGWREGCETCLRRTSPGHGERQRWMEPPPIVVFWCEGHIEPGIEV